MSTSNKKELAAYTLGLLVLCVGRLWFSYALNLIQVNRAFNLAVMVWFASHMMVGFVFFAQPSPQKGWWRYVGLPYMWPFFALARTRWAPAKAKIWFRL